MKKVNNKDVTLKKIGIYGFQNKLYMNKWYIGQSMDVYGRWENDYKKLKCFGQRKFYYALKKYGYENFNKIILEDCSFYDKDFLDSREKYWINFYNSIQNGYNIKEGGSHGKHSEETKIKIKEARSKQKILPNHVSIEARKKMSDARKNRCLSKEHCIKLSMAHIGNKHTEETKLKISYAMKNRRQYVWTDEQRKNASIRLLGKKRGSYKIKL